MCQAVDDREGAYVAQTPGQGLEHSQEDPRRESRTKPRCASVSQSSSWGKDPGDA